MNKQINWLCVSLIVCAAVIVLAQLGSEAVTIMTENTPIQRNTSIIIDAGHGGEDGGAISISGIPESTYNLDIALRLEKLLLLMGVDTRMVRTTDTAIYSKGHTLAEKKRSDLKERVALVENTKNGILVSIHQNIFPDSQYHGAQVFYSESSGSKALAEALQDAIAHNLDNENRRTVKKANGIYLMEHIHKPGVLIECGFLSNPIEESKLRDSDYQKKLCSVIAVTVKEQANRILNPNT